MKEKIGLYIHVPFCKSKCPYCDFYSLASNGTQMDSYTRSVLKAVSFFAGKTDKKADTLYFGGGTPSVLGGKRLAEIIDRVKDVFLLSQAEITVEVNPSCDNLQELFEVLRLSGVNRISMGMQSAVDSERLALGRKASSKDVELAIKLARQGGISNISLDLMLGIPGMTMSSLEKSLDFILEMNVPHVSAYMLKIEENTPFGKTVNSLNLPPEDDVCDMYLHACNKLNQAEIKQYEVSNFSKAGFESRHNLKYWQDEEYIGIGTSAHSFLNGKRFFYPRDIKHFIDGKLPIFDDLGGNNEEKIMLGLRLSKGIEKNLLSPKAILKIPNLVKAGYAIQTESHVSLTPKGFLISNTIISELEE